MFSKKIRSNFSKLERRLPLERFIPAVFILFLVIFIILSIITYSYFKQYKEDVEWAVKAGDVINVTRKINSNIIEMRLSRLNYFLTDDTTTLIKYYNLQYDVRKKIDILKTTIRGDDEIFPKVLMLDSLSNIVLTVINNTVNEFERDKFLGEPALITSDSTEAVFSELSSVINIIKDKENKSLLEINSRVIASSLNMQMFIVLTSFFAFTVIGLSLYFSNKLIKHKNAAEELLQKSYDELEDRVEKRTEELKKVNEDLLIEISNRNKIENLLRESESRFRVMADSAPVMIWMSSKDKNFTFFNNGWTEFTGRKLEQELGNGWSEGIHPDDMQMCLDMYILSFDKRTNFEMEFRLKNAKGEYRWILDKGVPRYEGDEFSGYIGCCIDIQSRKMNEQFLNLQYTVSKSLTESAPINETYLKLLKDICTSLDWQFGIIWTVEPEKQILKPEAIWSAGSIHHKEYKRIYDLELQSGTDLPGLVLKSGRPVWSPELMKDYHFERKDLAYRLNWNTALSIPVTNGTEVTAVIECFNSEKLLPSAGISKIMEVIGHQVGSYIEKNKAEQKLKESYKELENRVKERTLDLANTLNKLLNEIEHKEKIQNTLKLFAHAIKGIKECVYITDLDNKTIFVNSAFESTYGYFEQELLNKEIPVLFSDEVSDIERREISEHTLRNGWKGELKNKHKNGGEFYISLSTSVIRNDEGKIEAIVGICQDITDIKASEQLIVKHNSMLNLINDVIIVTNKSFDLNQSINYTLNKVCRYNSWPAGHCYMLDKSGKKLVAGSKWNYNISEKYNNLTDYCSKTEYENGKGLVGESFASGTSSWINLSEKDENIYPTVKAAKQSGIKTAVLIPIIKQTDVIGILEFFIDKEVPEDNEILECLTNIGVELGSLADRTSILEQIKISERQFKAVADTANDAIITSNSKGVIVYINKSAEKIFGYTRDELVGKNLSYLMPGSLIDEQRAVFTNVLNKGELTSRGRNIELIAKNKSGTEFNVEISLAKWEINSETYFTAMIQDITERKEIENTLIEKTKMLLEAQQISKMGSWQWNVKSDVITWSEGMYNVYEVPQKNFVPSFENFIGLVHPDDTEFVKNVLLEALKNRKSFDYFHRIVTPSGKTKIIKAKGEVIEDESGSGIKVLGTELDITELKEAEEKIKISEKQLKESQLVAKLGNWEYKISSGEIFWSDELFRICGFKINTGIPKIDTLLEIIHPDDIQAVKDLISSLEKNPRNIEITFKIITGTGTLKYINAEILTEIKDDSKPIRYYGSIQDVTEIKIVEEELRQTNEKLLNAQKELIHNEKLAALGRFSSGIAHEIRNPLANISALSQLLSKSKLDEKSQKHLKYILINTDIADKIIKDLLNFASPDKPVFKNEKINEIINNVIESVKPRCNKSNIQIFREISNHIPSIPVDKIRIENALMNFISNAIDAMNNGGKLTVKTSTNKINNSIYIKISDTGTGITPENLDKIMEPFYTTKKDGTGLGLGLAYQAVKSHNGNVKIESTPGKGTVILIELPLNYNNQK